MSKEKIKTTKTRKINYIQEYSAIFSVLGINSENIQHEWNKEGDFIKEFNLYEDHPRPIVTPDTHSISY